MDKKLKNALEEIMTINENAGNNAYAIAYAKSALEFGFRDGCLYTADDINWLRTQCRYILSNLQYWRGERAREIKKILNDFI